MQKTNWIRRSHLGSLLAGICTVAALLFLVAARFESDFKLILPADGTRDVHPGRNIMVEVARPAALDNELSISLLKDGKAEVSVTVHIDKKDRTVVVDPVRPLDMAAKYKFCISASRPGGKTSALNIFSGERLCSSFQTKAEDKTGQDLRDAPILLVTGPDNPYGAYYAEIMKAEGMTLFNAVPAAGLDEDTLARHAVVLLGASDVPHEKLSALKRWILAGGTLVSMKPRGELSAMLCLGEIQRSEANSYIKVEPQQAAAAGITARAMQIHGQTVRYRDIPGCLANLSPRGGKDAPDMVARLYESPSAARADAAITEHRIGKGKAIVFAFDLARSIVLTRQGNPLWQDQERDGSNPRRPNDLFYPDYLDTNLMDVPQADEQQRLLANLIVTSSAMPLPRFWYLPERRRAAIIMVGDDHATENGTEKLFSELAGLSKPGCDIKRWECLRATAMLTSSTSFARETAETYQKLGFEIGVHLDSNCRNEELPVLRDIYGAQMREFRAKYPSLPAQKTQRLHCIVWNGWTDTPRLESDLGLRFDMNYYSWPPKWLKAKPGFMTGSALPMPFITEDGAILDVYQAPTQLVNQDGVPHREGVEAMLDWALGRQEYFGTFVTHYDFSDDYDKILVDVARERGVALISAQQMLDWLDARNRSTFEAMRWSRGVLDFQTKLAPGAEYASVLLQTASSAGRLSRIECQSKEVPFLVENIKGIDYASFQAVEGACSAVYGMQAG